MAFFKRDLYVGGRFDGVNGVPAKNVARWDGKAWFGVGDGLTQSVYAFRPRGKRLLMAAFDGIYQLQRDVLQPLGNGYSGTLDVTESDGTIFRSGGSNNNGVGGIAQWQDEAWQTLGSGIALNPLRPTYLGDVPSGDAATDVAVIGQQVYIGGDFSIVGNKPSNNFGIWANPAPLRPLLNAPANRSQISSAHPDLKWDASPAETLYKVQLRANNRRSNLLVDTTTTETMLRAPKLERDTTYLWHVRACNDTACSAWTNYWSFTVKP